MLSHLCRWQWLEAHPSWVRSGLPSVGSVGKTPVPRPSSLPSPSISNSPLLAASFPCMASLLRRKRRWRRLLAAMVRHRSSRNHVLYTNTGLPLNLWIAKLSWFQTALICTAGMIVYYWAVFVRGSIMHNEVADIAYYSDLVQVCRVLTMCQIGAPIGVGWILFRVLEINGLSALLLWLRNY